MKDLPAIWASFFLNKWKIKLATRGWHRLEFNVQPKLAVEWWDVLPVPLTFLGLFRLLSPVHPVPGATSRDSTELSYLTDLAVPPKRAEAFTVVNFSLCNTPARFFVACVTFGYLKMCCLKDPAYVCLKRMTFDHLWYAEYILLLKLSIPSAGFVVFADAFRVRVSPTDVLLVWALLFRTKCFASQLM